jgi:hypothetical protein
MIHISLNSDDHRSPTKAFSVSIGDHVDLHAFDFADKHFVGLQRGQSYIVDNGFYKGFLPQEKTLPWDVPIA